MSERISASMAAVSLTVEVSSLRSELAETKAALDEALARAQKAEAATRRLPPPMDMYMLPIEIHDMIRDLQDENGALEARAQTARRDALAPIQEAMNSAYPDNPENASFNRGSNAHKSVVYKAVQRALLNEAPSQKGKT